MKRGDGKGNTGPLDLALLGLSLAFLLGLATVFAPCAAREDGTWMSCHWAGRALTGAAAVLLALGIARLFGRGAFKAGLDVAALALCALCACLPGRLIGLCMMETMRCRRLTRPWTLALSLLIALAAALDLAARLRKGRQT